MENCKLTSTNTIAPDTENGKTESQKCPVCPGAVLLTAIPAILNTFVCLFAAVSHPQHQAKGAIWMGALRSLLSLPALPKPSCPDLQDTVAPVGLSQRPPRFPTTDHRPAPPEPVTSGKAGPVSSATPRAAPLHPFLCCLSHLLPLPTASSLHSRNL